MLRVVLDADVIDPEPLPSLNTRLFRKEIHRDSHGDPIGGRCMLEKLFHGVIVSPI
jgi:hypothetical protein